MSFIYYGNYIHIHNFLYLPFHYISNMSFKIHQIDLTIDIQTILSTVK